MRRHFIEGIVLASLLTATSAFAADLPARTYTKAPVVVDPGYNWSGFYVGLNAGYSWGRASETAPIGAPFPGSVTIRQDMNGGLGGGQVGYNWQIDRTWLVGFEADIQGTGERGRATASFGAVRIGSFGFTGSAATSADLPWFATFRGRVGILADPSLLLYGTGGLAVGEVKFTNQATLTAQLFDGGSNTPIGAPFSVTGPLLSERKTRVGWTAGAGVEKKFSQNWSAKLEYLYLDLGSATYFANTANAVDVSFRDHIFRAGINYAFSPAAVVAKY